MPGRLPQERDATPAPVMRPALAWAVDVLVAGFVLALTVPLVREIALATGAPPAPAVLNAVVHAGALAARRRAPIAVLVVVGATAAVHVGLGLPVAFLGPAALVALYTAAVRRSRGVALTALSIAFAVLAVGTLLVDSSPAWDSLALYAVLLTASWVLGDTVRRRQVEAAAHARRAEQLEQARLELARSAVVEERLRIARELHDVVAHGLTAVTVHAGRARLSLDEHPEAARDALGVIEQSARAALAELRQLLTVLRGNDDAPLAPAPGLAGLSGLVGEAVSAGLVVDVAVDGDLSILPPSQDLTAYRILQEALTNVVRHADATRIDVCVRLIDGQLQIAVQDDGHGFADTGMPHGGLGFAGMRERVRVYGGEVRAGAAPDGGFRVEAIIPVRQDEP